MTAPRDIAQWRPSTAQRAFRDEVARAFAAEPHAVLGRSRKRPIVRARQAASWLVRQRWPSLSWPQIGILMGGRDHSTVIYAARQAVDLRERDAGYRAITDALLAGAPAPKWAPVEPRLVRTRDRPRKVDASEVPELRQGAWCQQCDALVGAERAAVCRSRWCSLRRRA